MDEVILPESVEAMLHKICIEQCQKRPDNSVRRRLAEKGEEASLQILTEISKSQIKKSLSAFIIYMMNNNNNNSSVADTASLHSSRTPGSTTFNSPPPSIIDGETYESPSSRSPHFNQSGYRDSSSSPFVKCQSSNLQHRSPQFVDQMGSETYYSPSTRPNTFNYSHSPVAKRQLISDQMHTSPQFGDQNSSHSAFSTRQIVHHSPSELQNSPQFRENSDTKHLIDSPSSLIWKSPLLGDLSLMNKHFIENTNINETPVSHFPRSQMFDSPSRNLKFEDPSQLNYQTSPVFNGDFNHHNEAKFRNYSNTNETNQKVNSSLDKMQRIYLSDNQYEANCSERSNTNTRNQTFNPSPSLVQRNLQFNDQINPLFQHQSDNSNINGAIHQTVCSELSPLYQLEYRKLFLLLTYIGNHKLEEVMTPDKINEILRYKDFPMSTFEFHMWNIYGRHEFKEPDRLKCNNWDSRKTHVYYCSINPNGSYTFKGPYLNTATTHLQRVLGDENVLIVKFSQEGFYNIERIIHDGIIVGLKRFHFFVFKDGGREKKKKNLTLEKQETSVKCYFVCIESLVPYNVSESNILLNKIQQARCLFMHVHMVTNMAKYASRFSLILSKTVKLQIDLDSVTVKIIGDTPCLDENGHEMYDADDQPCILTDGTGYISEDLAAKCPNNLYKDVKDEKYPGLVNASMRSTEIGGIGFHNLDPPLLIQCRLFYNGLAVKGTLLVNRKLPPSTIHVRDSMVKVKIDTKLSNLQTFNSLEIVGISQKPKRTYLSKYLIALLNYGGVPKEYFIGLLENALETAHSIYTNERAALKVVENYAERDDISIARNMLWANIPLNEPFLQNCLSTMAKEERVSLKEGKIPLDETFYLMGTTDPTETLKSHQVCIILDNGQISGKVLVYRNPGLHFGDIHVLDAIYVKDLEGRVGNAKYAIFFSTKGRRSVANEIANGDFDGDRYWVSRNPQLLEYYRQSNPWVRTYPTTKAPSKKPIEFSSQELEYELFQQFLEARTPCYNTSIAADSWLASMDQLLTLGNHNIEEKEKLKLKIVQLIDIYYDALDAPKSGKRVNVPNKLKAFEFPHYMGKGEDKSYHSNSVLGKIFDHVSNISQNQNQNLSASEIWKLPCFDTHNDLPQECINLWKERYNNYRSEMTEVLKFNNEMKNEAANDIIKKYKEMLYGGAEFHESTRNKNDIYNEALAIYHVTYGYAMNVKDVKKCGFAWKVAGPALCNIYIKKQGETPLMCSPSVVRKIL